MKWTQVLQLVLLSLCSAIGLFAYADSNPPGCIVTVVKKPEWKNFDVDVGLYTLPLNQMVLELKLPKDRPKQPGLLTLSLPLDCKKYDLVQFKARFSPAIWAGQENTLFSSLRVWSLAEELPKIVPGKTQVQILVTFPDDFVGVPEPINTMNSKN